MVENIICEKCGKNYKKFYNYKNHYISCGLKKLKNKPENNKLQVIINNKKQLTTIKPKSNDIISCDKCYINLLKKNLNTHINKGYCQKRIKRTKEYKYLVSKGIKENEIPLSMESINTIYDIVLKLDITGQLNRSNVNININNGIINNTTNNTTNNITNNNITNNNITNNNITNNNIEMLNYFNINPIGKEDISHISKDEIIKIITSYYMAYPTLLNHIYERPENNNIYVINKREKSVMYLDETYNLSIGGKRLIDRIAMLHLDVLGYLIDDFENEISEFCKYNIETNQKFVEKLKDLNINEKHWDKNVDLFFDKICSISNQSKKILTEYQKIKSHLGLEKVLRHKLDD